MLKPLQGGGQAPVEAPAPQPIAEVPPPQRTGLDAVVHNIPEAAIVSTLINTVGTLVVNKVLGVPFDLAVTLTFGGIGTLIGASYGPAKQMLVEQFASHAHRHGAPLT